MQINECSKLGEESQKVGLDPSPICTASTTTLAEAAVRVVSLLHSYVHPTITPHIITEPFQVRGIERGQHVKQKRWGEEGQVKKDRKHDGRSHPTTDGLSSVDLSCTIRHYISFFFCFF